VSSFIFLNKKAGAGLACNDEKLFFHELADEAQVGAMNGDFGIAFKVIRSLTGFCPTPMKQ